jgi:hypothetical protein
MDTDAENGCPYVQSTAFTNNCNDYHCQQINCKRSNGGSCGFGGLGVACWPLVPKFAGSNPVEAVGFFRAKKSSAPFPSEGK